MYKKIFIITLLTFFQFLPQTIHASDYGLGIYPPLLRVKIKPGKSISQVFNITNYSATDRVVVARLVPFTQSDNQGNPVLDPNFRAGWLSYFSLINSQIKIDEPFTLKGKSVTQLVMNLTVPENVISRDLYLTLLISTYQDTVSKNFPGSVVSATIGSNLLVTINSEENPATLIRVTNFIPTSNFIFKIGSIYFADNLTPVAFNISAYNDGRFATEAKGYLKATSARGTIAMMDGILPEYLISGNERQLRNQKGQAFTFEPSITQIGPYYFKVEFHTPGSNASTSTTIFFLPIKAIIVILSLVSVFFITNNITSNNFKKRIDPRK